MHARSSIVLIITGVAAAAGLSACGRVPQSEKPDGQRPPETLQLSAAITDHGVDLSPSTVGGGPLRIVISNQSSKDVRAVLAPSSGDGARRSTKEPIAPGETAAIQATVTKGTWRLRAGSTLQPASLEVTRKRKSSDGELLLP